MAGMDRAALQALMNEHFPHGGIEIEAAGNRGARIRLGISTEHLRPGGTVSGPTLMTLADAAVYVALMAEIGGALHAVTVNLNISFLRRPERKDIVAEARLVKVGRQLAVGEVSMYSHDAEAPVARATVTYALPTPGSESDQLATPP